MISFVWHTLHTIQMDSFSYTVYQILFVNNLSIFNWHIFSFPFLNLILSRPKLPSGLPSGISSSSETGHCRLMPGTNRSLLENILPKEKPSFRMSCEDVVLVPTEVTKLLLVPHVGLHGLIQTHVWYKKKFGGEYPASRKAFIQCVLWFLKPKV